MRLLDHSKNVHSQTGEDGVIEKIREIVKATDQWCVEFGAWDGQHLSNTFNLVQNCGYSAVLIEGSRERFGDLTRRFSSNPKIYPLNAFVGFTSGDGLDSLLSKTPIPKSFDFLSIDIDGNDYHVWKAVAIYTPKVVCIEYNPSIPTQVEFVQEADPTLNQGSSLLSLVALGKVKGYELVAVTLLNAIFVKAEYFPLFGISDNSPAKLREDQTLITHLFCGYDGTIFIKGNGRMLWHGMSYAGRIRQLPAVFNRYSGNYGFIVARLFQIYRRLLNLIRRG